MLTDARRRELHGRVGAALEALAGDDPSPRTFAQLARHYTRRRRRRQGGRVPDPGRRRGPRHLGRPRGDPPLPARAGVPEPHGRRPPLARDALQDRARPPPGVRLRGRRAGLRRGVRVQGRGRCRQPELCERLTAAIVLPVGALAPGLAYVADTSALTQHLFRGLLIVDRELNVMPSLAENFRVSSDGTDLPLPAPRRRPLERRRAADGARLRLHVGARPRPLGVDGASSSPTWPRRTRSTTTRSRSCCASRATTSRTCSPRRRPIRGRGTSATRRARRGTSSVPLVSSGPFVLTARDEAEMVLEANPRWRGARGNLSQITIRFRKRTDDFEALWSDGGDRRPPERAVAAPGCRRGLRRDRAGARHDDRRASAPTGPPCRRRPRAARDRRGGRRGRGRRRADRARRAARRGAAACCLRRCPATTTTWPRRRRWTRPGGAPRRRRPSGRRGARPAQDARHRRHRAAGRGAGRGARPPRGRRPGSTSRSPDVILSGQDCDVWVCTWFADFPDPEGFFRGLVGDPTDPIVNDAETFARLDEARAMPRPRRAAAPLLGGRPPDRGRRGADAADRATPARPLLRRPWVQGVWANALTPLRLDQAVVERTRDPAAQRRGCSILRLTPGRCSGWPIRTTTSSSSAEAPPAASSPTG